MLSHGSFILIAIINRISAFGGMNAACMVSSSQQHRMISTNAPTSKTMIRGRRCKSVVTCSTGLFTASDDTGNDVNESHSYTILDEIELANTKKKYCQGEDCQDAETNDEYDHDDPHQHQYPDTHSSRDMQKVIQIAEEAAIQAGEIMKRTSGKIAVSMTKMNAADLVTESDVECQAVIENFISQAFPHDSFLGEENVDAGSVASSSALNDAIAGKATSRKKGPKVNRNPDDGLAWTNTRFSIEDGTETSYDPSRGGLTWSDGTRNTFTAQRTSANASGDAVSSVQQSRKDSGMKWSADPGDLDRSETGVQNAEKRAGDTIAPMSKTDHTTDTVSKATGETDPNLQNMSDFLDDVFEDKKTENSNEHNQDEKIDVATMPTSGVEVTPGEKIDPLEDRPDNDNVSSDANLDTDSNAGTGIDSDVDVHMENDNPDESDGTVDRQEEDSDTKVEANFQNYDHDSTTISEEEKQSEEGETKNTSLSQSTDEPNTSDDKNCTAAQIEDNSDDNSTNQKEQENQKEKKTKEESKLLWIVDPIDGTTNFQAGLPMFCVSIGIVSLEQDEPVVVAGVIYNPILNEMVTAVRGRGCYLNGKRLRPKAAPPDLKQSLVNIGFPVSSPATLKMSSTAVTAMATKVRGLRMIASASQVMSWVAQGKLTAYVSWDLNAWDVAAGMVAVEEAGGFVARFDGARATIKDRDLVVTCKEEGGRNFVGYQIRMILEENNCVWY